MLSQACRSKKQLDLQQVSRTLLCRCSAGLRSCTRHRWCLSHTLVLQPLHAVASDVEPCCAALCCAGVSMFLQDTVQTVSALKAASGQMRGAMKHNKELDLNFIDNLQVRTASSALCAMCRLCR